MIRSELLNHLPKPKQQPQAEPEKKKIEVEKAKPKRSRRPPQKQEEHVPVENKTIEVPKSFIPMIIFHHHFQFLDIKLIQFIFIYNYYI